MLVEVLRPIRVTDGTIEAGTVVDASSWRNLRQLLELRYCAVATNQAATAAKTKPEKGTR